MEINPQLITNLWDLWIFSILDLNAEYDRLDRFLGKTHDALTQFDL